jgi:hypothetical protein
MEKKNGFTKALAIVGTVLAWLPILAPVVFSAIALGVEGIFRLDYLMPAELFPVGLAGAVLLLWAGWRARTQWKLIGLGLGIAIIMLVGGQALAVVTGLASGAIEPTGWQWALVLASLGIFTLGLIVVGVGGILLLRDLFRPARLPAPTG